MKVIFTYAIFALIATVANIGGQDLTLRIYQGHYDILFSMVIGTAIGLVVKYLLDKHYIFHHRTRDMSHAGRIFVLYTAMGVAGTLFFWGVEFLFHIIYQSKEMRYLGGIIGLAGGYIMKFQLDKRFVFKATTQ